MIEFKNVVKKYDNNITATNNISVKIKPGEFVYVVGPSGAGKSTFIKMMYREEAPTSGSIIVNEYALESIKSREIPFLRRELGIVFQDFKLLPRLTVFENIAYALQVIEKTPEEVEQRVSRVLDLVGLSAKRDNFPAELSGGEQQRVGIARAIVNGPPLLIADEPTGNLDPKNSMEIMQILDQINQRGITVIVSTHDNAMVDYFRKRVITLDKGEIVRDIQAGTYE